MAEQKGFFRRMFSFGSKEEDRTQHEGGLASTQDTTAKRDDSAVAEIHQPAMAAANADTEAGAKGDEPAAGGIEPLHPEPPPGAGGVSAEKKTPN